LATGSPNDTVGQLGKALTSPLSEAQTIEIMRKLGASCDTRAVGLLVGRLTAESIEVRIAAIDGLSRLGDRESTEPLLNLLGDPNPRVYLALIPALAAFPVQRLRNVVLNTLARGNLSNIEAAESARIAGVAMLTLHQLTDPTYNIKALLFQFNMEQQGDPHITKVVESAMKGLPQTRNGRRELLAILNKHPNATLRRWAARWLGTLQVTEFREDLERAATADSSPIVRAAAAAALQQMKVGPTP
jgi:HEAT repeat protein